MPKVFLMLIILLLYYQHQPISCLDNVTEKSIFDQTFDRFPISNLSEYIITGSNRKNTAKVVNFNQSIKIFKPEHSRLV